MITWYGGAPTKSGKYLATVKKYTGETRVDVIAYSPHYGFDNRRGWEIVAWAFLPPPFDGNLQTYFDPETTQNVFEAAVREQMRKRAEAIEKAKKEKDDERKNTGVI